MLTLAEDSIVLTLAEDSIVLTLAEDSIVLTLVCADGSVAVRQALEKGNP